MEEIAQSTVPALKRWDRLLPELYGVKSSSPPVALTEEDETRLIALAKLHPDNPEVRLRVNRQYICMIIHFVKLWGHSLGAERCEDLTKECIHYMWVKAIPKFDPTIARFTTYLPVWIRREVIRALQRADNRAMYISREQYAVCYKVNRARGRLAARLCRQPNIREIADALNMPEAEVLSSIQTWDRNSVVSVEQIGDQFFAGDDALSRMNATGCGGYSTAAADPYHITETVTAKIELEALLSCLTDTERDLVMRRFGIGHEEHSLYDIGSMLGVSHTTAGTRTNSALAKLKKHARQVQRIDKMKFAFLR